jgi:hypothetical protein
MNPDDEHLAAQLALPWLFKGSLAPDERERVDAHLLTCAACRADLATLATIGGAAPPAAPACDPERALARLGPLLDDSPQEPRSGAAINTVGSAQPAANDMRWLRPIVVAQCAVIAVLLGMLLRPASKDQPYLALGAGARPSAELVVQFAPETPESELRRILQANGARIVDGPTASKAYLLDLPQERIGPVVAALRGEPAVRLAEPLASARAP